MRHHIKHFTRRHEPRGQFINHVKSGIGAIVSLGAVGFLSIETGMPLLIAPFGASAVLLFGQPKSPLAQPANVVGGYMIAALLSVAIMLGFPGEPVAAVIAVGVTIATMLVLRVTHPPAGAVPLVALASPFLPTELFEAVMLGSLLLVTLAVLHHLIPPRAQYPVRVE
ncbi:HPP family protein [Sinorhizobium sp. BG8]|uniref:HPP family protein n=1 Tax=Sinorhizobium sp. BG8 TaxID=2613773 RepID=UPI00193DB387|nr:HPP family protein [Sinorhizobium sp. BG8]QRM53969.1 HPP family protein [Sinorhizobium sp. BG8]